MRHAVVALVVVLAAGNGPIAADSPLVEREWTVDGVTRKALVHVPESAKTADSPLVFVFHGHGGTMRNAARTFRIHTLWPEAVVVYMQGLPTPGALTDPDGKRPGWQKSRGDQADRDLKFFDDVLAAMKKDAKIDAKRIYATGHSNGGAFTYLLWAARGDVFAAVAPSAGMIVRGFRDLKPLPAMHIAGEKDRLVKFENQARMMKAVRTLNGCDEEGTPWATAGKLVGTRYSSKNGTPFVSVIYPGTHQFPAEAPELIVKFFKENART